MSWVKRRGPNNPSPAPVPPVQMYNPNQHSTQENQWQNQQGHDNWYNQPHQQYQQPVPKQETQPQLQQNYWPQSYGNPQTVGYNQNAPQQHYGQQYQNQTGYYQNNAAYDQQTYGNLQYNQQYNQNNSYQAAQQQGQQNEGDAWDWGWGDEDNSNMHVKSQQAAANTSQGMINIGNTFVKDETWNWGVEDTKQPVSTTRNAPPIEEPETNDLFPKMGKNARQFKTEPESDTIKPLPPQDLLKVTGKRGKLDTPQWSTESQMSQESSDDILHTSESDKSHAMSRSSTISHSPLSGQEPSSSANLDDIPTIKSEPFYEDLASAHQFENKEIVTKPEISDSRLVKPNPTPPPPKNTQTPPLMPQQGNGDDAKNPYKRSTGLSHKAANKFRASSTTPPDSRLYQPSFHSQQVNLETLPDNSEQPDPMPTQPIHKHKPVTQWPDNNEAPINDRNQYLETGQLSGAGSQDYNQGSDVGVKQDVNDALPPPGLRRMVPGQMEQSEGVGNAGSFGDEPPPGLSRMVLGQTETVSNPQIGLLPMDEDARLQYEATGPPEGLHRMVPGESSSPESTLRHQQQRREEENDSESEFDQLTQHTPQPRSATIGADTPPAVSNPVINPPPVGANRSETIGGGDGATPTQDNARSKSASASSNDNKVDKSGKTKTEKKDVEQNNRRDSIEGETQENDISNITNSVRNLTVGENLTDGQASNNSLTEPPARRHSRQESSDSDRDLKKMSRSSRDKKSLERSKRDKEKEREKYRYSPDAYRDKRYDKRRYKDRRFEDDTDYYSDKDKERRTHDDRDYERKYSSLRKEKDKDRRRRDPREYTRDRREYYYGSRYEDEYENENRSRPSSRSDSMHESYREKAYRDRGLEKDHRDRGQRDRERERYRRQRDPREMFNPYQGFAYDPYNPYYQQYQYYENLRRTNPQAYAEWYRKYYQQAAGHTSSYGGEDRASVHSGRSSANDELAKDRYTRQSFYSQASVPHMGGYYGDTRAHSISGQYGLDSSSYARPFDHTDSSLNFEDNTLAAQRLTPAKFATAHIKASIASGKLLRILPHYPMDGQNATVELCTLQSLLIDDEFLELSQFPGPLVKGVTHKKTVIEYCETKIRQAAYNQNVVDVDSYVLMWELLILLIRQNGMVIGTDIAELLLKNKTEAPPRPSSVISSISSTTGDIHPTSEVSNNGHSDKAYSNQSVLKEEEITNKFREFLLYGSGKEALEWAMKHGLWGHALFLASKLDKRTYANVMMRFANGLTLNDPLQTLYQLLSGKMPAAVTCVSDEKWGDWRPHLAMILSNSSQRPELNCKAIMMLGDTLKNRGSLHAAQFCYLMAEVGFGRHDDPNTRLTLLGADHSKLFPLFASNEAIHMTEIYEYACGLNDVEFIIPEFQVYKYLLATRLADRGLLEKSLQYLEKISMYIISNPSAIEPSLVDKVYTLADRLKFYDPVGEVEDESEFGGILETSRPDHSWLKDLRAVQTDLKSGLITHEANNAFAFTAPQLEPEVVQPAYEANAQDAWQQQYDQQYQQSVTQQQWQPEPQQPAQVEYQQQENVQPSVQQNDFAGTHYQEQQSYWGSQPQQWGEQLNQFGLEGVDQQQIFYGSNAQVEPKEVQKESPEETPRPQISMPNQSKVNSPYDDQEPKQDSTQKKASPVKAKPQSPSQESTPSTGWFGGIFSKLALKPKNQMKLPDDKNPKIVWDQDKKRWTNVDEDPNDPANELKPPPKLSDMMPKVAAAQPASGTVHNVPAPTYNANVVPQFNTYAYDVGKAPDQSAGANGLNPNGVVPTGNAPVEDAGGLPKSGQPNMFKMQRGRNLKNSYVDVFNPGGKSSGPSSLPLPEKQPTAATQMNFFIPQPVADPNAPIDFLTPGGAPQFGEQQPQ